MTSGSSFFLFLGINYKNLWFRFFLLNFKTTEPLVPISWKILEPKKSLQLQAFEKCQRSENGCHETSSKKPTVYLKFFDPVLRLLRIPPILWHFWVQLVKGQKQFFDILGTRSWRVYYTHSLPTDSFLLLALLTKAMILCLDSLYSIVASGILVPM